LDLEAVVMMVYSFFSLIKAIRFRFLRVFRTIWNDTLWDRVLVSILRKNWSLHALVDGSGLYVFMLMINDINWNIETAPHFNLVTERFNFWILDFETIRQISKTPNEHFWMEYNIFKKSTGRVQWRINWIFFVKILKTTPSWFETIIFISGLLS
jgi:hypothetical protein